ncbi:MAG: AraC family transcriptional regulator [Lactimicrobium sp.]|jgi:AraC-like DNA-binding protein|uniref:AraC family transcriptional regulator n=1 Tax=Lactimicrobium sp. TaxID=2563780 RepID=UPI002F35919A
MEKEYKIGSLPVSFVEENIAPGEVHKERAHWHDGVELIRVRRGHLHCHVNNSDFLLGPDEMCFINQDQVHRIYGAKKEESELEKLIVNPQMLAWNQGMYEKLVAPVVSDGDFAHIQMDGRSSYAARIIALLDEIKQTAMKQPDGYELEVAADVHLVFRSIYMIHEHLVQQSADEYDLGLQRKMVRYIQEHYMDKISLEDIADSAGISRTKCTSLFKVYTETTPVEYLNSYRLEEAARRLVNEKTPVAEIALACGFSQQSYFGRMFQKEYGMTPLVYRKTCVDGECTQL